LEPATCKNAVRTHAFSIARRALHLLAHLRIRNPCVSEPSTRGYGVAWDPTIEYDFFIDSNIKMSNKPPFTSLNCLNFLKEIGKEEEKQMQNEFDELEMKKDKEGLYEHLGIKFFALSNWVKSFGGKTINFHIQDICQYGFSLTVKGDTVKECLEYLKTVKVFIDRIKGSENSESFICVGDLLKELDMEKFTNSHDKKSFIRSRFMFTENTQGGTEDLESFAHLVISVQYATTTPSSIPDVVMDNYVKQGVKNTNNIDYVYYHGVNYIKVVDDKCEKYMLILVDPKGFIIPNQDPIEYSTNLIMKFDEYYKIVTSLNPPDVISAGNKK